MFWDIYFQSLFFRWLGGARLILTRRVNIQRRSKRGLLFYRIWLATTMWLEKKNQLAIFCDFFDTLSCLDSRCPQSVTIFVRDTKNCGKMAVWRETVRAVRVITPHSIERQHVVCHSWAFIRRSCICSEETQKRDKKDEWLHVFSLSSLLLLNASGDSELCLWKKVLNKPFKSTWAFLSWFTVFIVTSTGWTLLTFFQGA